MQSPLWPFTAKGSTQNARPVLMCAGVARVAPEYPQSCTGSPRVFEVRDTLQEGAEVASNVKKIPLDESGLFLLGTALYLGELDLQRKTRLGISRFNELQSQGLSIEQIEHKLDESGITCFDTSCIPKITAEMSLAKSQINAIGCTKYSSKDAKAVTIHSFQFEWFHLYENRELALFLKDLGKSVTAFSYFSDDLISEAEGSDLNYHLWRLLFDELALLAEGRFTLSRSPRCGAEREYSLLVSDLCGPQIFRGRPVESGFNDDTEAAVNIALEAMSEKGLNAHAATKEAIAELGVVLNSENGSYVSGIVADMRSYERAFDRLYRLVRKRAAKQ